MMLQHPQHHFKSPYHPKDTPFYFQFNPCISPIFSQKSWKTTQAEIVDQWWKKAGYLRRSSCGVGTPLTASKSLGRIASTHTSAQVFWSQSDAYRRRIALGASEYLSPVLCPENRISKIKSKSILKNLDPGAFDRAQSLFSGQQHGQRPAASMEKRKPASAARKHQPKPDQRQQRDPTPEQFLATKKHEAVEAVMSVFNQWLDKRLAIISYAYEASGDSGSGRSGTSSGASSGSGEDGKSGRRTGSGRAKRQFDGDDSPDGDASGDGNGKDGNGNKRVRKDDEGPRLFACPFFQHDPSKNSTNRSCIGPGWPSIHRLKEHLTRCHRLPKHTCPRCREPMRDNDELMEHLRADVPCCKKDVIRLQGIDDAQEKKLKERKKTSSSLSEEQKWRDIYMILFPDANRNALPSPYHDGGDSVAYAKSAEQFKKFKKHIQKELPKLVRNRVERRFDSVQADVLDGLPDIVRDELYHLFKGLPQGGAISSSPPTPSSSSGGRTPRSATPRSEQQQQQLNDDEAAKAFNIDTYINDPNAPLFLMGLNDDMFNQPFDFNLECQSDSGYASNGTADPTLQDISDFHS